MKNFSMVVKNAMFKMNKDTMSVVNTNTAPSAMPVVSHTERWEGKHPLDFYSYTVSPFTMAGYDLKRIKIYGFTTISMGACGHIDSGLDYVYSNAYRAKEYAFSNIKTKELDLPNMTLYNICESESIVGADIGTLRCKALGRAAMHNCNEDDEVVFCRMLYSQPYKIETIILSGDAICPIEFKIGKMVFEKTAVYSDQTIFKLKKK